MKIGLCDICLENPAEWFEALGSVDNGFLFRFVCSECHKSSEKEYSTEDLPVLRQMDNNMNYEENKHTWIKEYTQDDFIPSQNNSEPHETSVNTIEESKFITASWPSPDFIKECLFGADPIEFIEKYNGFSEEHVDNTILALNQFQFNSIVSVKIAAIKTLEFILKNHPSKKEIISKVLQTYSQDPDDEISSFANKILDSIK